MNKKVYLDFERPLAELEEKIDDLKAHAASENIDMSSELATLEKRAKKLEKEIYTNLTQVLHRLEDFFMIFAESKHQRRFGVGLYSLVFQVLKYFK